MLGSRVLFALQRRCTELTQSRRIFSPLPQFLVEPPIDAQGSVGSHHADEAVLAHAYNNVGIQNAEVLGQWHFHMHV